MCCPSRNDDALEGYQLWKSKAAAGSACDYTFHMGVTKFEDKTEGQLREIVSDGISSFKIFLAYKGFFGVDDAEMYQTMALAQRLGVIVTAHCENAELIGRLQQKLLAEGKTGPEWHEPSPPGAGGSGRHASLRDVPRDHRRRGLRRSPFMRAGAADGGTREGTRDAAIHRMCHPASGAGQDLCGTAWR